MTWKISFEERANKKLSKMDKKTKQEIDKFISEKLLVDPIRHSEQLAGPKKEFRKARVGDYRLIIQIKHHEIIVLVLDVGNRQEIYKK